MKMKNLRKYFSIFGGIGIISCSGMFIVPLLPITILAGSQTAYYMDIMGNTNPSGIIANSPLGYLLNFWITLGMPPYGPIILILSIMLAAIGAYRNKLSFLLMIIGGSLFYLGMYVTNSLGAIAISFAIILLSYALSLNKIRIVIR